MSEVSVTSKGRAKRQKTSERKLTQELAVRAWAERAFVDIFVALEHRDLELIPLHLFHLHQGIEKLCKAYLLGTQYGRFKHLKFREAENWINRFAVRYGHDLTELIGLVSVGVADLKVWLASSCIDLLQIAYESGRYPMPTDKNIFDFEPVDPFSSSVIEDALAIARSVTSAIERDFGVTMLCHETLFPTFSNQRWQHFVTEFNRVPLKQKIAENEKRIRSGIEDIVRARPELGWQTEGRSSDSGL